MYAVRKDGKVHAICQSPSPSTDQVPLANDDPDYLEYQLRRAKRAALSRLDDELVVRSQAVAEFVEDRATLKLLEALWPALNTAALGPEFEDLRALVVFSRSRMRQIRNSSDLELVTNYDPVKDTGWPS